MENGTLTASDVALLSGNNGNWGDTSFMWVLALLILANGGFGGFGGYAPQYATQDFVQNGFNFNDLQDQNRDIMNTITNGTAQTVAAVNQAKYDNINVAKDIQAVLGNQLSDIRTAQVNALANQNSCCSSTLRAIDNLSYQGAMNTASINETTVAQTQRILDAITVNKMTEMQNRINQLELQGALAGVVRYPSALTYNAGASPFCVNGCSCMNM